MTMGQVGARVGTALKAALNSKEDDGSNSGSKDRDVARKVGTLARKGVRTVFGGKKPKGKPSSGNGKQLAL